MSLPRPWDPDKDDHLTMLYDMPLDDMPLDDMPVSPLSPWTVSTAPCPVSTSSTPLFGDFEVSYLLSITNEETAEDVSRDLEGVSRDAGEDRNKSGDLEDSCNLEDSDNEEDKSNDPEDPCGLEDIEEDESNDPKDPCGLEDTKEDESNDPKDPCGLEDSTDSGNKEDQDNEAEDSTDDSAEDSADDSAEDSAEDSDNEEDQDNEEEESAEESAEDSAEDSAEESAEEDSDDEEDQDNEAENFEPFCNATKLRLGNVSKATFEGLCSKFKLKRRRYGTDRYTFQFFHNGAVQMHQKGLGKVLEMLLRFESEQHCSKGLGTVLGKRNNTGRELSATNLSQNKLEPYIQRIRTILEHKTDTSMHKLSMCNTVLYECLDEKNPHKRSKTSKA